MPKVLVVDDEFLVADTLGLIFGRHGFETRVAYSAQEALECARSFRPDLLLCDITMPGRNGLELMADLERDQPQCRVLVLTGYYSNLTRLRETSLRRDRSMRVLTKPCDPKQLLREAGEILSGEGPGRQTAAGSNVASRRSSPPTAA